MGFYFPGRVACLVPAPVTLRRMLRSTGRRCSKRYTLHGSGTAPPQRCMVLGGEVSCLMQPVQVGVEASGAGNTVGSGRDAA